MKKISVICDDCNTEFKMGKLETEVMEDDPTIEHGYFKCPKCAKLYTVYYADTAYRKNVDKVVACSRRINELQGILKYKTKKLSDGDFIKYHNEFNALIREQEELMQENKDITKKYKNKYEEELICQN